MSADSKAANKGFAQAMEDPAVWFARDFPEYDVLGYVCPACKDTDDLTVAQCGQCAGTGEVDVTGQAF